MSKSYGIDAEYCRTQLEPGVGPGIFTTDILDRVKELLGLDEWRGNVIGFTDPPPSMPERFDVLDEEWLGSYDPEAEAIRVYPDNVRRCAKALRIDQNALLYLVCVHEASHWAHHVGHPPLAGVVRDSAEEKRVRALYLGFSMDMREQLAQHTTLLFLREMQEDDVLKAFATDCILVMKELMARQKPHYRIAVAKEPTGQDTHRRWVRGCLAAARRDGSWADIFPLTAPW